jgi:hypothetical protein
VRVHLCLSTQPADDAAQHVAQGGLLPLVCLGHDGPERLPAGGRQGARNEERFRHRHQVDLYVRTKGERRHEVHGLSGFLRAVDPHHDALNRSRRSLDHEDGTGQMTSGGERHASEQHAFEPAQPAPSEHGEMRHPGLRRFQDLLAGVSFRDADLDRGPARPEDIGGLVARPVSVGKERVLQVLESWEADRRRRDRHHREDEEGRAGRQREVGQPLDGGARVGRAIGGQQNAQMTRSAPRCH